MRAPEASGAKVKREDTARRAAWEAEIACLLPERLLEELRRAGIAVLRAQVPEEGRLRVRVRGGDAARLQEVCARFGLQVLAGRALGRDREKVLRLLLPALAGFAACCALLLLLTGRIWTIDARCPEGGDARELLAALGELGVRAGAAVPEPDALARQVEGLCPQFSHVSLRVAGVALLAEGYLARPAPEVYDLHSARDLVASCDAVVEEITVRTGTAAVRRGDVVRRGQALILGEERAAGEETRGVGASGTVTGRVYSFGEAEAVLLREERRPTGRVSISAALGLFGWEIPLAKGEEFARCEETAERLPVGGMFLPLTVRRVVRREVEVVATSVDSGEFLAPLEARALAQALNALPPGAEMIDKWADYSMMEENTLRLRLCVEARVSLAATREQLRARE